tara:strand:+ start:8235 stop:8558 length:324 start_codon:yes stop_codon:yes gene_type:complete
MKNKKKLNFLIFTTLIFIFFDIRLALTQAIEFKGEVPLYEKNTIVSKPSKKVRGFWKNWRATCITSRGAILKQHNNGFRDCMDNTGPDSSPRNNVKKSLDFIIQIKF